MILMPPHHCRRLTFITSIILATALTPEYINAEPMPKKVNDKGTILSFPPNMAIRDFIAAVSGRVGKNFLIDPRVNGNVTVIIKTPLDKESLYDVFLDVLRTHGAAAIEQGDVVKIVPLAEAKQNTDSSNRVIPRGGEQITRVVKIKSISAGQLVPVLRPLMPAEAYLQAYPTTNTLVISDSEKNIQRLLGVIKTLDKPGQERDEIVPIYQANAEEVLRTLKETQPNRTETSATVTVDKRTNSIVISGNTAERERYVRIIKKLDMPIANQSSNHVVALKYAKAVDLAPLLDKVINRTGSGSSNASSAASTAGAPGTSAPTMSGSANSSASNIVADEATNSLIISADLQRYQSVLEVLKQLDIPRLQVMIEAIIAEVSVDKAKNFGIQWGFKGASVGVASGGIASISASDVAASFATSGLSAIIGKGDIVAMLKALETDTDINILSAPRILTLDNKEAEMVIGENVPFITGSFSQTGTANGGITSPFQTIQRQDVGLTLKVKPQINQGGMITLEIYQENSSVKVPAPDDPVSTSGPTTTKRSMKSNISIVNGNVLALGGLMEDKANDAVSSVPFLGDIPLLGWLFKSQGTSTKKTTLMVFIKPTIVDARTANNIPTQKAISEIEKEQLLFNQRDMLLTPEPKRNQITPEVESIPELDNTSKTVTP